jgi:hypothetical protein
VEPEEDDELRRLRQMEIHQKLYEGNIRDLHKRIEALDDINKLQGDRIDELTGALKGLYIAVVCGLPLEDQLRRVRQTVDTEESR